MNESLLQIAPTLKWLLCAAWLLPLAGFAIEVFGGWWGDRKSKLAAYMAVFCIGMGFVLSLSALVTWANVTHPFGGGHEAVAVHDSGHEHTDHEHVAHANDPYAGAVSGTYYTLAEFGDLKLSVDYYIDGLTLAMFCMVTLIATCIHVFAIGYMSDELTEDYEDHQVHLSGGRHFHRPGRFYRFFSFLSLFCFSMLGIVLAGNIFQVFIFWELVGVSSYLLIGFYNERHSASTAANKAFIMNRVGDFGFLIGLMVLWTYFGTFSFAHVNDPADLPTEVNVRAPDHDVDSGQRIGLFQMLRDDHGHIHTEGEGRAAVVHLNGHEHRAIPYWLLVVAGLGIFGGCIGKSAQFPLQTWLPDAMEGPTPVSALVHSATMVAAGVYLAGRFYPMFTPEVLLVIAYVGCITLFLGATIAIVATDIKRVLAYSTISQLGYMMLALGLGGWIAGLLHLVTHAFFKSLMFLCSGSVIHGCHHEQEMTKMGGLYRKMPWTAFTMLIGVIAICGLAIPGITIPGFGALAFSGYHSKDAIVATALTYLSQNPQHFLLFLTPLITAGITAFYMFRLWFMTFAGEPRDHHVYEHAHESPWVMVAPLVVLSFFAIFCAYGYPTGEDGPLASLLLTAEPAHVAAGVEAGGQIGINLPGHAAIHAKHTAAGRVALLVAMLGVVVSWLFYGKRVVDPGLVQRQFAGTYEFLKEKWQFDNIYDAMFVHPVHIVAHWAQAFDRVVIDNFLHGLSKLTIWVCYWDRAFDEAVVDRMVNVVGETTFSVGRSFKRIQTGNLRQYVMFIAAGVVCLFVLMFAFLPRG
ncbi:MAG: NADH-quinone oxidoreductase subunit L [Planctomycetaceae bacterium]|nr:NADH-quinone oxidoreductase subunit L [Planctomycetaceae bacterium]